MNRMARTLAAFVSRRRRSFRNTRGNVAIISALVMIPISFAIGMGIDYTLATRRQDQINGYADAAALAATTPNAMLLPSATARLIAKNMFLSQLATVTDVTYLPANVTVTAVDTTAGVKVKRTVTVTYQAASTTVFNAMLGTNSLAIGGSSSASSGLAPQTDFYLLLDTSPSMAIAATTAGINTMVSNTSKQGGCAFGCHESHPSSDSLGNPGGEDNFALARNLNVPLRIDLVNQATQQLMTVAQTTASQNNTIYRAAIYTMDYNFNTLITITNNLASAQVAAGNLQSVEVYDNNCLTVSNCNSDEDSYLDAGLSSINGVMPNPGNGTANAGDSPQEVVFIVSDGVDDELLGGSRTMAPINTDANWCTTIKARGIRIAFLYLTYNPLPTNGFYNANIAPFQSQIATDAFNCASPGLFFQVNTDGDISAAMTALFQKVVATAHLIT